jgi:hypothetical protein
MKLPNAELATVDIRKLREYSLSLEHDTGKHKARVFQAALGLTAVNAEELRLIILEAIKTKEAELGRRDEYGHRYRVDFMLEWEGKSAQVRSGWIIENEGDAPRLTGCYVL